MKVSELFLSLKDQLTQQANQRHMNVQYEGAEYKDESVLRLLDSLDP